MIKKAILTYTIIFTSFACWNYAHSSEASGKDAFNAFSKRFVFNTQREIASEISAESIKFVFSTLKDIETEITALSSAFNFNTDRNIEWEITAVSSIFDFTSLRDIQPQIVAQSLPFAFNTSRDIELQIIAQSTSFTFNTNREIALQMVAESQPFVFNTLRNIAQQIIAESQPFVFNTSNSIALVMVAESDPFLFNTLRNIAFQIIAEAEFIPLFDPLPIELLSFNAFENNNKIDLEWATASETNNHFFTLLRSSNGISFEPLTTIQGAGNSIETIHYQFTDKQPISGINYYQLRQTDFDGSQSDSHIVAVYFLAGHEDDISVVYYSGYIHVKLPWESPERAHYILFDTMGRKIKAGVFEHSPGQLSLIGMQDVQNGVLLFSLSGNNTVYNKKLLKH